MPDAPPERVGSASPPIFVPIALPLDEATAAFNACRATFAQLTAMGKAGEVPELARAMYKIAEAIDARRAAPPGQTQTQSQGDNA